MKTLHCHRLSARRFTKSLNYIFSESLTTEEYENGFRQRENTILLKLMFFNNTSLTKSVLLHSKMVWRVKRTSRRIFHTYVSSMPKSMHGVIFLSESDFHPGLCTRAVQRVLMHWKFWVSVKPGTHPEHTRNTPEHPRNTTGTARNSPEQPRNTPGTSRNTP